MTFEPEHTSFYQLEANDLTVHRGGRNIFSRISFVINSGQALIVTGPNGAGKSSLLRTLAGLVPSQTGTIELNGGDPELRVLEYAHYSGHDSAVKPALTVYENLAFWQKFTARADIPGFCGATLPITEALDYFGIGHTAHLPAAYLSAGQTRRLGLSRLLLSPRPVWLMDEPTSALDAASETLLIELMNHHLDNKGIIITATHTPLPLKNTASLAIEPNSAPVADTYFEGEDL